MGATSASFGEPCGAVGARGVGLKFGVRIESVSSVMPLGERHAIGEPAVGVRSPGITLAAGSPFLPRVGSFARTFAQSLL